MQSRKRREGERVMIEIPGHQPILITVKRAGLAPVILEFQGGRELSVHYAGTKDRPLVLCECPHHAWQPHVYRAGLCKKGDTADVPDHSR